MSDTAKAPAEQDAKEQEQSKAQEPVVKDPEAVLKKNEELLTEVKRLKKIAQQAEGFDFEKAREAIAAQEKAEQEHLAAKGEWEKLKKQLDERHLSEIEKERKEKETLLGTLTKEKLTNVLTEKGVLPDRAKYLVHELLPQVELKAGDEGFSLSKRGGIGDAAEFDSMLENIKASSPFFFGSTTASGSGASGSSNNGNNSTKVAKRSEWDGWSPEQRSSFAAEGGKITD